MFANPPSSSSAKRHVHWAPGTRNHVRPAARRKAHAPSRLSPGSGLGLAVMVCTLYMLVRLVGGQNMAGSVRSVTYFPTCQTSGLAGKTLDPSIASDPAQNPTGASTICQYLGGDSSSIVGVRVKILPLRVAGTETFVFQLGALPPPLSEPVTDPDQLGNTFDPSKPSPICAGQKPGRNCLFLPDILTLTFSSSDLVAVYKMDRDAQPYAYGYRWHQCQAPNLKFPSGPQNAQCAWTAPLSCTTMGTHPSIMPQGSEADQAKFLTCMQSAMPSAGQILNSGTGVVCPNEYPDSDKLTSEGIDLSANTGIYPRPNGQVSSDQCCALMCPSNVTDPNPPHKPIWEVGVVSDVGPVCWLWRIDPQPRALLNAEILVTYGNSGATSTIRLSSFQNGAMQLGGTPGAPVLANVLGVDLASAIVADSLPGGIVVCDTCPTAAAGVTATCKNGLLSDYSSESIIPQNNNDLFLQMGRNPWRDSAPRLYGISPTTGQEVGTQNTRGVVCTVPTRACRQRLLNNNSVTSFWMYIDPERLAREWTGGGCNSNGLPTDAFCTRPELATYACTKRMNGACIPGYDPGDTVTPCQIQYSWAQQLIKQATTGDSVSYGLGMPRDFNPADPQYRVLGPYIVSDAKYGSGDQSGLEAMVYLPAAYLGEATEVAPATFSDAGMLCNVVSQSTSTTGIIEYYVTNTGETKGSFCVTASFEIPASAAQTGNYTVVGGSTPVCFDVEAGATVQGPPIQGWSYPGPAGSELTATLTLTSQTTVAYYPKGIVLATVEVACNTLTPSEAVQVFQGADLTQVIQTLYSGQNASDYVCNWYGPDLSTVDYDYYCQWWQVYKCYQGTSWSWCVGAFIGRGFFVVLLLLALATGCVYCLVNVRLLAARRAHTQANKLRKNIAKSDQAAIAQRQRMSRQLEQSVAQMSTNNQIAQQQAQASSSSSTVGKVAKTAVGLGAL